MRLTAVSRWYRAVTVLAVSAACAIGGLVAVPGVLSASPAGASPISGGAHVPQLAKVPSLLTTHLGHVVALSTAKPVPASWPRPGETLQGTTPPGPAAADKAKPIKSTNWSGYADTGKGADFTKVSASWTVPGVEPSPVAYSASWIGIDGYNNNYLIQAGTEQDWIPDGVVYYAWYELIPAAPLYLGQVYPGDHMYSLIDHVGTSSWEIEVADLTRHVVWSGAVSYTSPGTSAEWIQEAPTSSVTFKVLGLAKYGSMSFTNLGVAGPGTAAATMKPIYMYTKKHGSIRSYPDQYNTSTDSFDCFDGNSGTATGYPAVPVVTAPPPTTTTTVPPSTTTTVPVLPPSTPGYWLVGLDGGVFGYGSGRYYGSTAGLGTGKGVLEVTSIAPTPDGRGYWLVSAEGGLFPFGDAKYYGSLVSMNALELPIIKIVPSVDGHGYYMVAIDGSVFAFGDAHFEGSCGTIGGCGAGEATSLITDSTGNGYWVLTANCDLVAFGDSALVSSFGCESEATATKQIARAVIRTPDGNGFWVLLENETTDTIYPEGDASSYGNWESQVVPVKGAPAEALLPTSDGRGAWLVLANGHVEDLGDAQSLGDLTGTKLTEPIFSATGS
jgi:hypothetical protein